MSLTKVTYSMISGAPANVLDFGADPTGLTDSQPAIDAALNSGAGAVYFPDGTYLINDTLDVPNGVSLFGENMMTTKIVAGTGMADNIKLYLRGNQSVSDLYIDGNFRNQSSANFTLGSAIYIAGEVSATNVVVTNVFVYDTNGSSIASQGGTDVAVYNFYAEDFQDHGIYFAANTSNIRVDGFNVKSNANAKEIIKVRENSHDHIYTNGLVDGAAGGSSLIYLSEDASAPQGYNISFSNITANIKNYCVYSASSGGLGFRNVVVDNFTITGDGGVVFFQTFTGNPASGINQIEISNSSFEDFSRFFESSPGSASLTNTSFTVSGCLFDSKSRSYSRNFITGYETVQISNCTFKSTTVKATLFQRTYDFSRFIFQNNLVLNYDILFDVESAAPNNDLTNDGYLAINGCTFENMTYWLSAGYAPGSTPNNIYAMACILNGATATFNAAYSTKVFDTYNYA